MSDINSSGMDLELLARGNNMFVDSEVPVFHNGSLQGGVSGDNDGGDASMMILIAVVMGCVAALVLLYIVRQHNELPEQLAAYMEKKVPTGLMKAPPNKTLQNPSKTLQNPSKTLQNPSKSRNAPRRTTKKTEQL